MTNFKKQIFSVLTAGSMVLNVSVPAFASTTIEISGNGAKSENYANVEQENTQKISQENTANVTNTVDTDANTGDNEANYNTGGDVGIQTGDAKVKVNVSNDLNRNAASINCCEASNTEVKISGNGADSDNLVELEVENKNSIEQDNDADVDNNIDVDATTGDNEAGSNTGGDVVIKTGSAKVDVDVKTVANVNSAKIGGGANGSSAPTASFWITGNGADSENWIDADLENKSSIDQDNDADIDNDVDVDATTGDNDANFNTGGDVVILTGDAKVDVDVDNLVNFNFADIDCGCVFDVLAKIAGNGADSENGIELELENKQKVEQENDADLDNDIDVDEAATGDNEAGYNTGEPTSDPAIVTGDAVSETSVSNSGNVNSVGDFSLELPELPGVDFSFNFAALWAFFGLSH